VSVRPSPVSSSATAVRSLGCPDAGEEGGGDGERGGCSAGCGAPALAGTRSPHSGRGVPEQRREAWGVRPAARAQAKGAAAGTQDLGYCCEVGTERTSRRHLVLQRLLGCGARWRFVVGERERVVVAGDAAKSSSGTTASSPVVPDSGLTAAGPQRDGPVSAVRW